jgi:hypothetical protein
MDTTPKKEDAPKGINWLSILGIFALVVLIVIVIWAMMLWNKSKDNPLLISMQRIAPALEQMQDMTQSQIDAEAAHMTAELLAKDPYGYIDRFVVIDGDVSAEESNNVNSNIVASCFSDAEYKAYVLDEAVVLVDISGENVDVKDGTTIRGFGKVFVVRLEDVWDLPIVGEGLEREYANIEGMATEAIFHISKGIEVISVPVVTEDELLPGEMGSEARTPDGEAVADGAEAEPVVEDEAAPEEEAPGEEPEEPAEPEEGEE